MGVNKNTVFLLRHKVLDCISSIRKNTKLKGQTEADETYHSINLKGTKPENMPRYSKPRSSKGGSKRGISNHQVCIASSILTPSVEDDILYKTMFETLYYCGLRRGELRGLTWKNIDFDNQYLSVNKNIVANRGDEGKSYMITTPKTKSSIRNIPIPKVLMEDMKKLYEISKKHYGFNNDWYLFGDTEPITNGKLRCRKNKNCKLAEVKQIGIHDFRHSCASLLINSGATINVVAKYLGHTKIDETLNTYSHLFKNQMNEIINIIDKLN